MKIKHKCSCGAEIEVQHEPGEASDAFVDSMGVQLKEWHERHKLCCQVETDVQHTIPETLSTTGELRMMSPRKRKDVQADYQSRLSAILNKKAQHEA